VSGALVARLCQIAALRRNCQDLWMKIF
jgi:hypothetical protein